MERLTEYKRGQMASKYANLNALLADIKEIDDEIASLRLQITKLTKDRDDIHREFHQEVIKVEPTEVCEVKSKKPNLEKDQVKKLLEAAKKDPKIQEQVCKILGLDYVVIT